MRCRFTWAQWRVNKCKISTKKDSADPNNLKSVSNTQSLLILKSVYKDFA